MNGSPIHKFSNSWRMARRLELINNWLSQHQAITCKHTRREGNKLADFLANIGVEVEGGYTEGTITNLATTDQQAKFQEIVIQDQIQMKNIHQDVGATSSMQ